MSRTLLVAMAALYWILPTLALWCAAGAEPVAAL